MGIDIGSSLFVGLPHPELVAGLPVGLQERLKTEDYYNILSEDGELQLERAFPWFDAGPEDCLWGYHVAHVGYRPQVLSLADLETKTAAALVKFKSKTGLDGRLYLTNHVT